MYLLLYNIPRFNSLLPAQGLPLWLEPLEMQHMRRPVLQCLRVQLSSTLEEPSMTVCRGAVRSLTQFNDALSLCTKLASKTSLVSLFISLVTLPRRDTGTVSQEPVCWKGYGYEVLRYAKLNVPPKLFVGKCKLCQGLFSSDKVCEDIYLRIF